MLLKKNHQVTPLHNNIYPVNEITTKLRWFLTEICHNTASLIFVSLYKKIPTFMAEFIKFDRWVRSYLKCITDVLYI